jgi:hypothetical protein
MSEVSFVVVSKNGLIDVENPSFDLLITILVGEFDVIFVMNAEVVFFPVSVCDEETTAGNGFWVEINVPI